MSNEHLMFLIQKSYPHAVHGKDFWVAQNIDPETDKRTGNAFIVAWKMKDKQPDVEGIRTLAECYQAEWLSQELTQEKESSRAEITSQYGQLIKNITDNASSEEQAIWPFKLDAAQAFLDDRASRAQEKMLQSEAKMTGEDVKALVQKIIDKNSSYLTKLGTISGLCRAWLSDIEACQKAEEIEVVMKKIRVEYEIF